MKTVKISPSILSSDFANLGNEVKKMELCQADMLHLDVMDGAFVPNITFGPPIIKAIRKCTDLEFDVHLMINNPLQYIEDFAKAGADIITFHTEAGSPIEETIECIRLNGCKPALCVKPKTDITQVFPFIDKISMVLIMTVEPGFGGQSFMPKMLDKIKALDAECKRRNLFIDIQVDGGINEETITLAAGAGANVFVAGSAIFGAKNPKTVIENMRNLAITASIQL
ncbi:MAG TPA: ribulose-phosphate 3-epimerase [Clostridia bacterium]|nr:ribulose-phosphate 3-epimerase [Clostridia bacterium]